MHIRGISQCTMARKRNEKCNTGKEERKKTAIICRGNSLIKVGEKIKSRIKTIWIDKSSGNWNRFYILKLILFLYICRSVFENKTKRSIDYYKVRNKSKEAFKDTSKRFCMKKNIKNVKVI